MNFDNDSRREGFDDVPVTSGTPMKTTRRSKHCYAGKSALCWEVGQTKADVGQQGDATVFLQGCPAIGEKVYDWKKKITLQFSLWEMTQVINVLTHSRKEFKASNHGVANDKGFEIVDQSANGVAKYFVKIFQAKTADGKGGMFAVPVAENDSFEVLDLLVGQVLRRCSGCKTAMDVINMCKLLLPRG